ncbi:unnamed protein product [Periconia digitata]|uniref:Uncharacterized protein n=1 Tax=Periconia digitata TaxID=1303443 RepID=A0A9W4XR35_9PLEO|nr:unnamed protein product [Periconia digitata]
MLYVCACSIKALFCAPRSNDAVDWCGKGKPTKSHALLDVFSTPSFLLTAARYAFPWDILGREAEMEHTFMRLVQEGAIRRIFDSCLERRRRVKRYFDQSKLSTLATQCRLGEPQNHHSNWENGIDIVFVDDSTPRKKNVHMATQGDIPPEDCG